MIGSTIHKHSVAPAFTDVCIEAPFSGTAGYIDWVIAVIKDYNIDLVIPSFELHKAGAKNLCRLE